MEWYALLHLSLFPVDASSLNLVPPRQVSQLRVFTAEVTKVAIAVGTEGRLGGQAVVPDAKGEWKDLLDNVNLMAGVCICSAQMRQERPLIVDTA
jgi:hypothetical protein